MGKVWSCAFSPVFILAGTFSHSVICVGNRECVFSRGVVPRSSLSAGSGWEGRRGKPPGPTLTFPRGATGLSQPVDECGQLPPGAAVPVDQGCRQAAWPSAWSWEGLCSLSGLESLFPGRYPKRLWWDGKAQDFAEKPKPL